MTQTLLTYTIGEGDGSTYANGSNTTTLVITDELSGEVRNYAGFTYMDSDEYEDVLFFLHYLWHKMEEWADEEWAYTVTTEASK